MDSIPDVVGVIVIEHETGAGLAEVGRVQVPVGVNMTVFWQQTRATGVPTSLSPTVAVQDVDCPNDIIDGLQATVVLVDRLCT